MARWYPAEYPKYENEPTGSPAGSEYWCFIPYREDWRDIQPTSKKICLNEKEVVSLFSSLER